MDPLSLFCTGALLAGGLYWFVCVLGPAEQKGKRATDLSGGSISAEKVQDNYKQYWSFFRRPKEIETADKVPDFVDTFYNLVTDIYEWGWGQSFHFSPPSPASPTATPRASTRRWPSISSRPSPATKSWTWAAAWAGPCGPSRPTRGPT